MIEPTHTSKALQSIKSEHANRSKELKEIEETYKETRSVQYAKIISEIQSIVQSKTSDNTLEIDYESFQDFLSSIEYEGKPIASLSKDEAAELVSEDGFFGVRETSDRISQYVISGAKGDEMLLREGRKGILQGLADAEEAWGGRLPDIAYETMDKAVALIDKALADGGFSVLDVTYV